jgi:hypothetical protein
MKIQILKDTSKATFEELPPDTILVYREGYELPDLKGVEYFDVEDYKAVYSNIHSNCIIVVGYNRIIKPSNRCDFIFEHLTTLTANQIKYSIDNEPFLGEPWRYWWHQQLTGTGKKFGIPYSYTIETEWQKWFYRDEQDCRLSGANIKMFIDDVYSDLDKKQSSFTFYAPSDDEIEWYEQAKEHVFAKYGTPKMLITNLLKMVNEHFEIKFNYDSYRSNDDFLLPELGVYKFMAEENKRRMDTYNSIIS